MQGIGGLDAIVEEPNIFEPVLGDARGNLEGYYSPLQVKTIWNSSRPTGYGAVPGYRPLPLDEGVNLVQSSGWQGAWSDVTGFYWRGKRYYDPVAGRWVSADSVWNGQDPNYFTFCGGDPINSFDPDGRWVKGMLSTYGEAETRRIQNETGDSFQIGLNTTEVINRASNDGASGGEALAEGGAYLIGSFTGFTPAYEGFTKYDIAGAYALTDPVDIWGRRIGGSLGVVGTGFTIQGMTGLGSNPRPVTWQDFLGDSQRAIDYTKLRYGGIEAFAMDQGTPPPLRTWDGQILEMEDLANLSVRREGVIYKTPDPYVGSTVDLEQRAAWAADGIDRSKAKIVDTFIEGDNLDRYTKERAAIEAAGGLKNLKNKILPPDPSGH
jgi:RHS repeat-associated protein